jgi:hypothetical protein
MLLLLLPLSFVPSSYNHYKPLMMPLNAFEKFFNPANNNPILKERND